MIENNHSNYIARLLLKELQGTLGEAEAQELQRWRAEDPEQNLFFEELHDETALNNLLQQKHPEHLQPAKERIWDKIESAIAFRVVPLHRRGFFRVAVAACIAVLIIAGGYFIFFDKQQPKDQQPLAEQTQDVKPPATNRAMITLTDGSTLYLDSANNGQLAMQGNVKLVKLANGQIAYETAGGEILKELQYNTLSNPRGSKVIDMTLADGSHVWLNAGSSVTYPVAFLGNERKVNITGEAYFEVARNPTMPFTVSKGGMSVQVLGTKFNVNAYDDETDIRVTLLEGSVKVSAYQHSLTIKPNQQAVVTNDVRLNTSVNLDEVMAWKNGLFNFNGADMKTIMRQVARWYDVEVQYSGSISPQRFGGDIDRDISLLKLLPHLERYGVKFRLEGRKIIVSP